MTLSVTQSTNKDFQIFSGTFAEVVEGLEDRGIPLSKIVGNPWYNGTAGSCCVLIKLH